LFRVEVDWIKCFEYRTIAGPILRFNSYGHVQDNKDSVSAELDYCSISTVKSFPKIARTMSTYLTKNDNV
jgi:hypothetical protein